jgi:hypothetical protein
MMAGEARICQQRRDFQRAGPLLGTDLADASLSASIDKGVRMGEAKGRMKAHGPISTTLRPWSSAMFTLEVHGVAVAVTDASETDAREIFSSDEFLTDLAEFTSDGKKLWDGASELLVRAASGEESDILDDVIAGDFDDEDDIDLEDGPNIVFLLDIDQLSEDDDDA